MRHSPHGGLSHPEMGEGNSVSIVPIHADLTTQNAANVLNVSRPFLVQSLKMGYE